MAIGSNATADGVTARPDYPYEAPASFAAENSEPTGDDVYNVLDYGAVADADVDSREAIQAAIDDAFNDGGGIVYIPAGVYGIGSDQDADGGLKLKAGVFIKGDGMGETVLRAMETLDRSMTGIIRTPEGNATDNCGAADLTLDGNRANITGTGDSGKPIGVDGFAVGGAGDLGIASRDVSVLRVEAMNCSGYGFDLDDLSERVSVTKSVAHNNGKDGFAAGHAADGEFAGNLAFDNGKHGFNIGDSTTDFLVEGNMAHGNGGAGIAIQRGSEDIAPPGNIVVRGNVLEDHGREGILVQMAGNVLIEDNTIDGSARSGIRLYGASHVTVRANTITNSSQFGNAAYADVQVRSYDDTLGASGRVWGSFGNLIEDNRLVADGALRSSVGIEEQELETGGGLIRNNFISGQTRGSFDVEVSDTRILHAGSNLGEQVYGSDNHDRLGGGAGDDKIKGETGNDLLNGGSGADKMYGGAGDDGYIVDNDKDEAKELAGEGFDRVNASVTYTIKQGVEMLVLTGSAAINGTGTVDGDFIIGNGNVNQLAGAAGDDKISGRGGNDTLVGGDGNDQIDGGAGDDLMTGGAGDDRYVVDAAGDRIVEQPNGGKDAAFSRVGWTLGENVEALILTGNQAINGTGNAQDNKIAGNSAANILSGAAGNDTLVGGRGADTIFGGDGDDKVLLEADGANDAVHGEGGGGDAIDLRYATSATNIVFAAGGSGGTVTGGGLGADNFTGVEHVAGSGFADTVTGSANSEEIATRGGDDIIFGGGGDDVLDGGAGNDRLSDGAGADSLHGGAGDDVVMLAADGALDVLWGYAGIDTLDLAAATGATKIHFGAVAFRGQATGGGLGVANFADFEKISGSAFADTVSGGSGGETLVVKNGDDRVNAGGGNDTIWGGRGNDTLAGGLGNDSFAFSRGDFASGERDTIEDFHASGSDRDTLRLEGAAAQYSFVTAAAGSVIVTHIASGGSVEIADLTQAQLAAQTTYF